MDKLRELVEEFREVVGGRGNLVDSVFPPILFVLVSVLLDLEFATWSALAAALLITGVRLIRREPLRYALGGVGGVALAVVVARLLGRAEGYFLPAIVSGAGTALICILSVLARRPLVAWTSFLTRHWPLEWYWHPKVRPAYSEVTLAWGVFFVLRLVVQLLLFQAGAAGILAVFNVVMGWPATIVLLIASYVYGTWRLRNLSGPSVEEFKAGAEPPWTGQQRGF